MAQKFYDTHSASIREFTPLTPGEVSLYYCGATVQGKPHVGHIRSAIVFDILIRWLEFSGYQVRSVRNVTDIDDKILNRSADSYADDFTPDDTYPAEEAWFELAYRFERYFNRAYAALGVRPVKYEPRATGHIPEMIALIQRLIDNGHAYPAEDGSANVYFSVTSWSDYGELTRQSIDQLLRDAEAAGDDGERGKRDPRDFALWKARDDENDPRTASWDSAWGLGRPGWHIECSAMATKYLGPQFDIHGGGLDLRFPHHENELAQSRAAGDGFAQFWLHNGLVTREGEKMSKSVGNTISPEQMMAEARPKAVRYFLGQAHYRSQLDYQPSSLTEAGAAVERIETFQTKARQRLEKAGVAAEAERQSQGTVPEDFITAMEDDLNVPQALAVLHQTVKAGNIALAEVTGQDADLSGLQLALDQVDTMVSVLGLDEVPEGDGIGAGAATSSAEYTALSRLIDSQLQARQDARAKKDWATADQIRDALTAAGVVLEDTAEGTAWHLGDSVG